MIGVVSVPIIVTGYTTGVNTGAVGTDDTKEWWQLGPQRLTVSSGE
jgi:hypothetical protein